MFRTVYIKPDTAYYHPIKYVMGLIQHQIVEEIKIGAAEERDSIIFDLDHKHSEPITIEFYIQYEQHGTPLPHKDYFDNEAVIHTGENESDLVATIFYMVNCLQERSAPSSDIDQYGRFKYTASYQFRFNCVEDNLVLGYIHTLVQKWNLTALVPRQSRIFMSHDIDALDGSWMHIVYDLLRQKRIKTAAKALSLGLKRKLFYRNISDMLTLLHRHHISSTFFFIPAIGKGRYRIQNADYNIEEETELLQLISSKGHSLGLHKSSHPSSLSEELLALPFKTTYNRYHFLAHQPHEVWAQLESAGIAIDASLGFAEHIGFRNSYGSSFQPYNPTTRTAYHLLITPLLVMDGTLWTYMRIPPDDLADRIIQFIEKNKTDCLISILWHNTSLTEYPYPGLLDSYIELLEYIASENYTYVELDKVYSEHIGE